MTVVADFSVPAVDFPFGRLLDVAEGTRVSLDRVIPVGESVVPYVWVEQKGIDAVESVFGNEPAIRRYEVVDAADEELLVRIEWHRELDGVVGAIHRSDGTLLKADGRGRRWQLQLRFDDHDGLTAFSQRCSSAGLDVALERILDSNDTGIDGVNSRLTEEQRRTLDVALEEGYFDVPRGTTLSEMGERLDVSDSAVSQRLRRGTETVLRFALGDRKTD